MESTNTKKRVKIAIIAVAVAVLAIVGVAGTVNADRISHFIKKKTSSAEEYYRYVEKENRDDVLKSFSASYDATSKKYTLQDQQKKTSVKVEVGDALKPMVSSFGIESLELEGNSKVKGKEVTGRAVFKANDKDALTCITYMNYQENKMYVQFPELTESYLDFSNAFSQTGFNTNTMYAAMQDLPDGKTIRNIMTTYSDIVYDNFSEVKMSNDTLKVEKISEKCTRLEVKADAKTVYDMIEKAARTLENDKDIKSIIEKADKADTSAYADFQQSVREFYEEMSSLDDGDADDMDIQMEVYVDSKGTIIGRNFTVSSDGDTITLNHRVPEDGKKFASEFSVAVNGVTYVTLSGSGERKSGKVNANYTVSMDESLNEDTKAVITDTKDMITLKVKDLDEKALADGIVKGEFTLSSDKIAPVALYSLQCKLDGDKNSSNAEIKVMSGKTPMVTLKVASGKGEDPKVEQPTGAIEEFDATSESDLQRYTGEMDLIGFISKLQDNCGVDLSSLLGMMDGGMDTMPSDTTDLDALLNE